MVGALGVTRTSEMWHWCVLWVGNGSGGNVVGSGGCQVWMLCECGKGSCSDGGLRW